MQKNTTEFGRWVKKKLIDLNMTQAELAKRVGCSRHYINQILAGTRKKSKYIPEIKKILKDKVA